MVLPPVRLAAAQLGLRGLVQQMRDSDFMGAPLLFQAAVSGSMTCLKQVVGVIKHTLGGSALREQVNAVDCKSKTIAMAAAVSGTADLFDAVKSLIVSGTLSKNPNSVWEKHHLEQQDSRGRTLLHHVAADITSETLENIVTQYKKFYPTDYPERLNASDSKGRTPLMYVLRNKPNYDAEELKKKLDCLTGPMKHVEHQILTALTDSAIQDEPSSGEPNKGPATRPPHGGLTALMNAAHGGSVAFKVARTEICKLWNSTTPVPLHFALGTCSIEEEDPTMSWQKRCGTLLAAATSGGDPDVLDMVLSAIQVKV